MTTPRARSLFGRNREQAQCYAALDAARARQRSLLLVEGDAGIGKTALAADLARRAGAAGFRVLSATAHPNLEAALLPIAQAFDHALQDASASDTDASLVLGFLHGDVDEGGARGEHGTPGVAMTLALGRLLERWQAEAPLLIWFDDVHWMADSAVSLLTYLALGSEAASSQRTLLVLGYRADEASPALQRLLRQVRRDRRSTVVPLGPLDELALFELARERLGTAPAGELVADLREYSRGNALLAEELLRRHEADGRGPRDRLDAGARGWADAADLVGERFSELPRSAQRVASAAAFLESEIDPLFLARVLGSDAMDVERQLAAGLTGGVLEGGDTGYRFAHPILWQAAYLWPGEEERERLHASVAAALLARAEPRTPTTDLAIARHVIRAGALGAAIELPASLLRAAGEHAYLLNDWGEAARCLAAHLAREEDADLEAAYLLAQAWYRAHDVARAIADFEAVAAAAELREDWSRAALALIGAQRAGLAHRASGSALDPERLQLVLERLGTAGGELRARAAQVTSEVQFARRDYAAAVAQAEMAQALAASANDAGLRVQASLALGLAHWGRLDVASAAHWFGEAQIEAERTDDVWVRGWAPVRVALVANMAGRIDEARAVATASTQLYERSRDWSEYSLAHTSLAVTTLAEGNLATSERHALLALSMVERSEYGWAADIAYPTLACVRALRGEWDETRDVLLAWSGRVDRPWEYWSLVKAWQGGVAYARQALETFAPRVQRVRAADLFSVSTLCAAAEVALIAEDRTVIERWLPYLEDVSTRGVVLVDGWTSFVPTLIARALVLLERHEEAGRAFTAAAELAVQSGLRLEAARTRLAWASYCRAAGDGARALILAEAAADEFATMALAPLEAAARQLLTTSRARATEAPNGRQGLTAREIEVLRALTRGLTNDQIAEELVISPSTARRHVANIYLKIDVPNRAAAAVYAAAHGLLDAAP